MAEDGQRRPDDQRRPRDLSRPSKSPAASRIRASWKEPEEDRPRARVAVPRVDEVATLSIETSDRLETTVAPCRSSQVEARQGVAERTDPVDLAIVCMYSTRHDGGLDRGGQHDPRPKQCQRAPGSGRRDKVTTTLHDAGRRRDQWPPCDQRGSYPRGRDRGRAPTSDLPGSRDRTGLAGSVAAKCS